MIVTVPAVVLGEPSARRDDAHRRRLVDRRALAELAKIVEPRPPQRPVGLHDHRVVKSSRHGRHVRHHLNRCRLGGRRAVAELAVAAQTHLLNGAVTFEDLCTTADRRDISNVSIRFRIDLSGRTAAPTPPSSRTPNGAI